MRRKVTVPAHLNADRVKARVVPMEPFYYRGDYRPMCKIEFLPRVGFLKIMLIGDEYRIKRFYFDNQVFQEYEGADIRNYFNGVGQLQLCNMEDFLTDVLSKSRLSFGDIDSCLRG